MNKKLSLAMLNKREEEIEKKEMNALRAGSSSCPYCDMDCDPDLETDFNLSDALYWQNNCFCGSIWSVFGLAWTD